jgi:hypothetical protein
MLGAGAMLMSSCIGKFALFNKVLDWNRGVTNDKFINWLVFLCLNILPVYYIAFFADVILFNSLEFWTGENPMAGVDMNVKGEKGEYHVKSTDNGYRMEHLESGVVANLVFDAATQTWSIESNGESAQLVSFADGNANVYYNGSAMNVDMAKTASLMAAR